jgi:hypothetical protein
MASAEQRSPFAPAPLQNLRRYYELLRPCAPHWYSRPRGDRPLDLLPSHRRARFPRSTKLPGPSSRRLPAGHRPSSKQVSLGLYPGPNTLPGFDVVDILFDPSSAVHLRSSSWSIPDALQGAPCPRRSPPGLLTRAARGGLKPGPAARLRGAYPHQLCSIAPPFARRRRIRIRGTRWSAYLEIATEIAKARL